MEEVSAKRRDIEARLVMDSNKIKELRATLEKSDKLSADMVGILESFQGRLNKLDNTIMPVYKQTEQLTKLQENVDHTLTALERVIGYHHVADSVEAKLKEGPSGNIEGYLKLLDKLRAAVDFFKHNNPSSMELSQVNTSFDQGIDLLEKEFRDLLRRHSMPLQMAVLHNILEDDRSKNEEGQKLTLQHLPDSVVRELHTIAKYVVGVGDKSDILLQYSSIRSATLGRTLNSYMEAGVGKKSSMPFLQKPSPAKKQTKTKRDLPARSKLVPGKLSTSSVLGDRSLSPDEQLEGASVLIKSSVILLRLLQTEKALMEQIIPLRHQERVFTKLSNEPIDYFITKAEAVLQLSHRQLSRHEFMTIIPILKVVEKLHQLLPDIKDLEVGGATKYFLQEGTELQRRSDTLDLVYNEFILNCILDTSLILKLPILDTDVPCTISGCILHLNTDNDAYEKFRQQLGLFEREAVRGMEEYITFIKGDSEKHSNLPKDGTVHELTSNTMWFFELMLEFSGTVGRIHCSHSSYDGAGARGGSDARDKSVGKYIAKVIDALVLNIQLKARTYESNILSAVFSINNLHFVQETYRRRGRMVLLLEYGMADIEEHFNTLIREQRDVYSMGFSKLLSFLGNEQVSNPPSKSQKQHLKDKFKGFNNELDELFKIQSEYSVPNADLRHLIRESNIELIGIPYESFYKSYSIVNFTKNPDKYVKYTPEEVKSKLNKFFDQGAP